MLAFGSVDAQKQLERDQHVAAMEDVERFLMAAITTNALAGDDPAEFARSVAMAVTTWWDTWSVSKFLNEIYQQLLDCGALLPDDAHADKDILGAIAELIQKWEGGGAE
ncbi:MAG: hypothetical protein D6706_02135 [Chloroflexi bacterium]|nr:MAG: hypothetical protein D6706_02135 [Chloroflexota bacterium]